MLRMAAIVLFALIGVMGFAPEIALSLAGRSSIAADLPDESELPALLGSCQITSEFGFETALCPQAHGAQDFSPNLYAALVASEDSRFLSHGGVDPVAVFRAALGLFSLKQPSGGSTITQQLARTLLLDRGGRYTRKLREWVLARRIEHVETKSDILTAYLNVAPQGHGLFGFDAAARYYLGKSAKDLSVAEAALLVSMLPRPIRDPSAAPEDAYRATLDRIALMRRQQFITADEAAQAGREAHRLLLGGGLPKVPAATRDSARHPFEYRRVRDLARQELEARGIAPDEATRIFVTLDPRFQAWADAATAAHPDGYAAASLFMSPSGRVLAVSGTDYGASQFNAAFQARRSLGSIGKVPLYILAHERPSLLRRSFSTAPIKGSWPNEPSGWCRGEMRLLSALARSCNRPFTRLAGMMPDRAGEFVRAAGLYPPDNPLLTPLGGVHGNLLSATRLFAAIANGGDLVEPTALVAVARPGGAVTLIAPDPPRRLMSQEVARAVALDLRTPVTLKGGTARRAASPTRSAHVSGKTGTSDENRDAWFVGFTNDFVGGIWAYRTGGAARPAHGGGYPAAQFGRIVDRYWIPRNAEAASGPPAFADLPQAVVFRWTRTRFANLAEEWTRPVGSLALLLIALLLARPWDWTLRPPRWSLAGRGEIEPEAELIAGMRP